MVITSEFVPPQSPVMCEQRDTKAVLNNQDLGLGTLFVTERTLCWKQQDTQVVNQGFTIDYKDISVHAISNDNNLYPGECIYILLDRDELESEEGEDEEVEEGYSESVSWELILIPSTRDAIDVVFSALNQAQLLNPDPEDVSDVDSLFEDAEDDVNNHNPGEEMNVLLHQMQNHSVCNGFNEHTDEEQFEDAD